jgi:methionine-rich copper-binding protein CopC
MRQQSDERELMRSYLLGSLDDARLEQVEMLLLSDSQFQNDLRAAQDELIDDYAFGVLSGSERESFERHFLSSPERIDKLRFARAVNDYLGEDSGHEKGNSLGRASWWRTLLRPPAGRNLLAGIALAACLLIVVGVLVWRDARQRQAIRERIARAEIESEVALWTRKPPVSIDGSSRFARLTLTPGIMRESVGVRRVVIAGDTPAAQLRLELTDQHSESYEATLLTDEDVVVFSVGSLRPENDEGDRVLILIIPAKFLPAGDYKLKLRGTTTDGRTSDAGSYPFQVVHRNASP